MKNGIMPKLDEELEKTALASLIITEDRTLVYILWLPIKAKSPFIVQNHK